MFYNDLHRAKNSGQIKECFEMKDTYDNEFLMLLSLCSEEEKQQLIEELKTILGGLSSAE